jgi:hypothetical protein
MRRTSPCLVLTLLVAMLLFTGCELSGNYHGDNVDVQFGNTNVGTQAHTQ